MKRPEQQEALQALYAALERAGISREELPSIKEAVIALAKPP